jgi:outer membrane protein assembly factor BamA
VGFGAIMSLARFHPEYAPFRWRLEVLVFMTAKSLDDGGVDLVFHDHYAKLDLPGLLDGRLRLNLKAGYARYSNSGYYGMGNNARRDRNVAPRLNQYDRVNPEALVRARIRMLPGHDLLLGGTLTYNKVTVYPGSVLERDLNSTDPVLRSLVSGTGSHWLGGFDVGWIWDTRDHDLTPSRGMFHELSWRLYPDGDLTYGGINTTLRFYHRLLGEKLVLAWRLMFDAIVGNPPFYELARTGGLYPKSGIGGGSGVRGLPLHRYHGKVKVLGNFEFRSKLLPFEILNQHFNLGAVAFLDAGRVFTDFSAPERFDGNGLGLKWGVGAGARLQWGESFLLRSDLAWSPDSDPIGFYINVGHIF